MKTNFRFIWPDIFLSLNKSMKGFTLIELLIVVSILGILAVALLLTINPGEAQKKARDVKRQGDLKTLTTLIENYLAEGNTAPSVGIGSTAGVTSSGKPVNAQQSGSSSWIGIDTSRFSNTIPTDPLNQQGTETRSVVSGATTTNAATVYRAIISGGDYEVDVRQESTTNANKVNNDGGDANQWFEAGNKLTLFSPAN